MEVLKVLALLTLWLVESIKTQNVFTKSDFGSDYISRFNGSGCQEHQLDGRSKQYYRYLQESDRDSRNIYVGAMNYLFKLQTSSLTCLESFKEEPDSETNRRCRIQGKSAVPDCQNHIRVVMEYPDHLLVCGTGAYAPKKFIVNDSLDLNSTDTGVAMCPFDPNDNYTAILVSDGNPCNATVPYFGTYTDFIKSQPVLYRPKFKCPNSNQINYTEKTTDREDINWFNSPQFVGSFEDKEKVMFFFRETSVEHPTLSNKIYSRVGKVCKKDLGGGGGYLDMTKKKWLSFQKARLVCSVPGNTPYYYDDIYDVYQSGDWFFALFYRHTGVDASGSDYSHIVASSAICVYQKSDIEAVFRGDFQYRTPQGRWETLPHSSAPNPRLDNCSAHEDNPDIFKDKVSQYQLMAGSVQPKYGQPIFYKSGVQFINIAVSETKTHGQKTGRNIYLASNEGEIYDIFFETFEEVNPTVPYITSKSPTIYRPFGSSKDIKYVIWEMKYMNGSLVFGTDYEVTRLDLANFCKEITKMDVCVTNTKCKWNDCSNKCVKADDDTDCADSKKILNWSFIEKVGVLESLKDVISDVDVVLPAVGEGLYTTLPLETKVHVDHVIWTRSVESNPCIGMDVLEEDSQKYAQTKSGDLVIRNVTQGDNNVTFTACSFETNRIKLKGYTVIVAEGNEHIIEIWKQQFNEWSTAFVKWKGCAEVHFSSCSP